MQEQGQGSMQEQAKFQQIPVKVYRSADRLMIAAPMPGMEPEDISVEVTDKGNIILQGELRATLKGDKELLIDEWSVGGYYREMALPDSVNAEQANVTYGNGVLVVAMPLSDRTNPARLTLETVGPAHGERIGNWGHE